VFDRRRRVLDYYDATGRWLYDVDLERCRTSAEVLDWIFQVAAKTWADDRMIAGLVRELDRRLHPQGTLCAFGADRGPIDIRRTLTEVAALHRASADSTREPLELVPPGRRRSPRAASA
jgi:hypothetical protein